MHSLQIYPQTTNERPVSTTCFDHTNAGYPTLRIPKPHPNSAPFSYSHNPSTDQANNPLCDTHPRPRTLKAGHISRNIHRRGRTRKAHRHPTRRHSTHSHTARHIVPAGHHRSRHIWARRIRAIPSWGPSRGDGAGCGAGCREVVGRVVLGRDGRGHVRTAAGAADGDHGAVVRVGALVDLEGVEARCEGRGRGPSVGRGGDAG